MLSVASLSLARQEQHRRRGKAMNPTTMVLGGNAFVGTRFPIAVNGKNVFRVRQRPCADERFNSQAVASFAVYGEQGARLAAISESRAVYVHAGYYGETTMGFCQVTRTDGTALATVRATSSTTVTVTGTFHFSGVCMQASEDALDINGHTITGRTFVGCTLQISGRLVSLVPSAWDSTVFWVE
jgi:hypothetical protein